MLKKKKVKGSIQVSEKSNQIKKSVHLRGFPEIERDMLKKQTEIMMRFSDL